MSSPIRSIAAVLPRYGKSLGGGAETLTRALLLALADAKLNGGQFALERIEVWTTCALDHRTWENALPAGRTDEDGFAVHRFPVDERDLETFITAELSIAGAMPLSIDRQLAWLASGVNSRALYDHIARFGPEMDVLLFAPYLFPTSFWGAMIHPERSILIPCLHNEPYAYLEVFRPVMKSVAGFFFNAEPELELATQIFGPELKDRAGVVGMGFVPREAPTEKNRRERPYLLYSGRKEQGKNLDKLIRWFDAARPTHPELELVLIGSGSIDFLQTLPPGVVDLGFVSEEEKASLMANAVALCQPSTNESFSIVLMEAWQYETPVLVHADCAVTKHHAVRSGGGLYFRDAAELAGCVGTLLENPKLRRDLGAAGRRYVETEYAWEAVLERLSDTISRCGLDGTLHGAKIPATV